MYLLNEFYVPDAGLKDGNIAAIPRNKAYYFMELAVLQWKRNKNRKRKTNN